MWSFLTREFLLTLYKTSRIWNEGRQLPTSGNSMLEKMCCDNLKNVPYFSHIFIYNQFSKKNSVFCDAEEIEFRLSARSGLFSTSTRCKKLHAFKQVETQSQWPGWIHHESSPVKIWSVKLFLAGKSLNFLSLRCILHNLVYSSENFE